MKGDWLVCYQQIYPREIKTYLQPELEPLQVSEYSNMTWHNIRTKNFVTPI